MASGRPTWCFARCSRERARGGPCHDPLAGALAPGGWTTPEVPAFSGQHPDIDPFVSPDGRHLYFSSIRPLDGSPRQVVDLWRVERRGGAWGPPERLPVSSDLDDLYPSVDRDGRLYFGRPLPEPERTGAWGIWVAEPRGEGGAAGGEWGPPTALPPRVNAPGWWSFNPEISPDGSTLFFTRLNPGDAAAAAFGEIHRAIRAGGEWGPPEALPTHVNTPADEFHPSLSPDGCTLYFVRRDPANAEARGRLMAAALDEGEGCPTRAPLRSELDHRHPDHDQEKVREDVGDPRPGAQGIGNGGEPE